MDLLFKRYADPFLFINQMIRSGRFDGFVVDFIDTIHKEREEQASWEYFLHKVWEGSFKDFKASVDNSAEPQAMTETMIETTVQNSMNILKNFNPNDEGGED